VSIVQNGRASTRTPLRRSSRPTSRRVPSAVPSGVLAGVLAVLLVACGVPVPAEPPTTGAQGDGAQGPGTPTDRLVAVDDGSLVLTSQLEAIALLVRDVESLMLDAEDAAGTGDTDASRIEGAAAVARLLGPAGGGDARGLIPAIEPDRSGTGSDDLITTLITSAGDIGGERSRLVLELVRDPMLGDLGAWQRDPIGVIGVLRTAVDTIVGATDDVAALDAALLQQPGELTRALGYALAVAATDDPVLSAHASRQAAGRLGVVLVAVELAIESLEASA